jgi:hypothetical protein
VLSEVPHLFRAGRRADARRRALYQVRVERDLPLGHAVPEGVLVVHGIGQHLPEGEAVGRRYVDELQQLPVVRLRVARDRTRCGHARLYARHGVELEPAPRRPPCEAPPEARRPRPYARGARGHGERPPLQGVGRRRRLALEAAAS